MFYTIYQICNIHSGKIYIGMHQTNDLNDEYMGSGLAFSDEWRKHLSEAQKRRYVS